MGSSKKKKNGKKLTLGKLIFKKNIKKGNKLKKAIGGLFK